MKIRIEWPAEGGAGYYRETRVDVGFSRRGNHYCQFQGQVFVWKEQKIGEPVLSKVDGKWQAVGRVSIGGLFIGPPEVQSYAEWCRTPEGKAKLEADFQLFRQDLASFRSSL